MAVDNTTIGSVLTIPSDLIGNLEKVDEKIKKIQESSRATAATFNTQFAGMTANTNFLINNLDRIIGQLGTIGGAALTASQATQGMGQGMGAASQGAANFGNSITGVIQAINQMIGHLQQTGQIGTSSLMAAKLAADKLMEAMQYKNTGSIALIKEEISGIDKQLKDTTNLLTKAQQDALVERKRLLQEELKEAERTQNERAVNLQKVLDRMAAAEERYQKKIQQSYKKTAEEYKVQNYAKNTTYQGALDFADNANSINRRLKAIEYLREARAKLNVKEDEYAKKLAEINAAIKRLDKANRDAVQSSKNLGTAYESLTKHHRNLLDTAGQLQRAFALMFSVSQIRGYISQIAKVRGEFELQQRSLEAILQNKTEADAIFNKTVALAVQSPFQIKDLISYTKQLAAYRIESDKLYDTTKMLADVSAGLGVDMQRLILAYGQVKAAAYLRGTEVRQFTEAGVNLYGELQSYFKEVKQEAYTTAQIVDMISKRMVTFEDIEAVFKRITDQGGIFYNMQAIQAKTLQGKIANLKDSIDVMLNSIGYANEGMYKFAIDGANVMIRNWQLLADVGLRLVEVLALIKLHSVTTGKAMGATFLDIAKFQKLGGIKNTVGLLSVSFKNFGRALYAAGVMAKAAMAQFLPLLLLMEVWQVISRIIDVNTEYNKTIRESTQAYADETAKINKVVNSIKDLQKAREDAIKSKDKDFDFKQNWDMQKSNLRTLYDRLKQEKLEVPLEISKVTQENIDSVVADAQQKLQLGYQMIADTQRELANSNSSFFFGNGQGLQSFLPDNFDTDMNDLENAAADVRAYATQIQASIALVGEQYKHLDDVSKKAYDNIKNGARKGEVDVNYVIRAYDELERILNGYAASNPMLEASRQQFNDYAHSIMGLKTQIEGIWQFNSQKETATKQLQDLFDSLDGIYGARLAKMKPAEVKVEWNKVATAAKLQDLERYILLTIAAKKYKFKVEGDEEDLAKQLNWVDDYIRKFFAGRKYSATVSLQTNTDAMEDFLNKGEAEAKTAQIAKKFVERFGKSVAKNAKTIKVDQKIIDMFSGQPLFSYKIGDDIDTSIVLQRAQDILAKATDLAKNGYGVDPFDKNGNKAAKAQRDILSEQIDLLDKIMTKYKELRKHKSASESIDVLKKYFADNIKYSKLEGNLIENLIGADGEIDVNKIAERIKTIALKFKEQTKKMGGLQKATDLKINATVEIDNDSLEAAKKKVDDAFNSLSVYTDLKKLGLGDADIFSMFGELPKTFEDVKRIIDQTFLGKNGEDDIKAKIELEKKFQEQIVKYNLDSYKEIVKAYGNQLDEQLQLDIKYAEEKKKINDVVTDPEQRKKYQANLDKWYAKESDANSWKEFQNSEFYIKIFENLDTTSSRVLDAMSKRLQDLRGSLKNLSPEQLKQVVSAMEQINTESVSRNPFKNLSKNIKEFIAFQKNRNKLEKDFLDSADKEGSLKAQSREQSKIVQQKKEEYDNAVKTFGAMSGQAGVAYNAYQTEKAKLDIILKELVAQGKITQAMADQIRKGEQLEKTLKDQVGGIADQFSQLASGWGEMESMLQSFGVELPEEIGGALNGLSQASGGIKKILDGDIIGGAFSTIAGIGNSIANIFGFGSKDKKLQKQIEEQQRAVGRLQRAYDKLEESISNAFTAQDLNTNTHEAIENLRKQNADIERMIALENDKKDSDSGQIEEWYNQIQDNREEIERLLRQQTEEMGGFGDKANYKSAAQEFADAWMDAFNESSNTLEALQDKMDDYFDNLLKKQLMQRAAGKYFEAVFKAFDEAVAEGSAGGANGLEVTREELEKIKEIAATQSGLFDEYAKGLMEILGVSPQSSTTLSQLQQGIQSLSESTGQALESLLNSIRFFVAQQTTDVSAIRQMLAASNNIESSSVDNSPMLRELQTQTVYLREIRNTLNSVVKLGGHPKNGAGIKVFQD